MVKYSTPQRIFEGKNDLSKRQLKVISKTKKVQNEASMISDQKIKKGIISTPATKILK